MLEVSIVVLSFQFCREWRSERNTSRIKLRKSLKRGFLEYFPITACGTTGLLIGGISTSHGNSLSTDHNSSRMYGFFNLNFRGFVYMGLEGPIPKRRDCHAQ